VEFRKLRKLYTLGAEAIIKHNVLEFSPIAAKIMVPSLETLSFSSTSLCYK